MADKPIFTISTKVTGNLKDPIIRVSAIEQFTQEISLEAGVDPADGIMSLLTAAAHIWDQCNPIDSDAIHRSLDLAVLSIDELFNKPRVH